MHRTKAEAAGTQTQGRGNKYTELSPRQQVQKAKPKAASTQNQGRSHKYRDPWPIQQVPRNKAQATSAQREAQGNKYIEPKPMQQVYRPQAPSWPNLVSLWFIFCSYWRHLGPTSPKCSKFDDCCLIDSLID